MNILNESIEWWNNLDSTVKKNLNIFNSKLVGTDYVLTKDDIIDIFIRTHRSEVTVEDITDLYIFTRYPNGIYYKDMNLTEFINFCVKLSQFIFEKMSLILNSNTEISSDCENLYYDIIEDLSNLKIIEEASIKEYNEKVDKINAELMYSGNLSERMGKMDWFNDTVKLNEIRNNVIELYRKLRK